MANLRREIERWNGGLADSSHARDTRATGEIMRPCAQVPTFTIGDVHRVHTIADHEHRSIVKIEFGEAFTAADLASPDTRPSAPIEGEGSVSEAANRGVARDFHSRLKARQHNEIIWRPVLGPKLVLGLRHDGSAA